MYLRSYSVRLVQNRFRNDRSKSPKRVKRCNKREVNIVKCVESSGSVSGSVSVNSEERKQLNLLNIVRQEGYEIYKCLEGYTSEEDNYYETNSYNSYEEECDCEECNVKTKLSEEQLEELWNYHDHLCWLYD